MTISTTQSFQNFIADGVSNTFDFSFIGDNTSYISVMITTSSGTTTLNPSTYSITLNAPAVGAIWGYGGVVTYPLSGPPLVLGTIVTISRTLPLTQTTSISGQGAFYPQVVEAEFDTIVMQVQQIAARTGQFKGTWQTDTQYNYGDVVTDGANGANTGNYYLCAMANLSTVWSTNLAAGDWSIMIDIQAIEEAEAAAEAAAAAAATSATAAASSATSAATSATNSANSATASATSATNSANSATSSATSATASANSATAAAASATSAATYAAALSGTSVTSITVGIGTQTFTTQAGKQFLAGQFLVIASSANDANYMHGQVTSYSGTTLVMNIIDIGGSGTHTDWNIAISGTQGPIGPIGNAIPYHLTTGTNSAYQITDSSIPAYVDGLQINIKMHTTSVANATLQLNSLGAVNLIISDGANAPSNSLALNNIYSVIYAGSKFFVTNPKIWSDNFFVTTGSANTYVLAPVPAIIAYVNGMEFTFQANFTNNGNCTLNVSGAGPVGMSGNDDVAFTGGEIINGKFYKAIFKTDHFVVINSAFALPVPLASRQGSVVVENSTHDGYTLLGQGTSGQTLISGGADADPAWATKYFNPAPGASGYGSLVMENSGSTGYDLLAPGTSNYILKSNGANAALTYASMASFFTQSIGANGYITLPGGLIIQWGFHTSTTGGEDTVTYPLTFPSATFSVVAIGNGVGSREFATIASISASNFTYQGHTSGSEVGLDIYWIAVGN